MTWLSSVANAVLPAWLSMGLLFAMLAVIEIVAPAEWIGVKARLRGLLFWAIFVPVSICAVSILGLVWRSLGLHPLLVLPVQAAMGWAGVAAIVIVPLIAAIINDFFFYWFHRLQHTRLLWRFHAVHHSIRELHGGSGYHHVTEPAFRFLLMTVPASLFTTDARIVAPMAMLLALQQYYVHSSTSAGLGSLRALFIDNRFHRIHHLLEPRHFDKNFGAMTTLWDRLFGTAWFPASDEWPAVGLAEIDEPRTVREYFDLPLRYRVAVDEAASPSAAMGAELR